MNYYVRASRTVFDPTRGVDVEYSLYVIDTTGGTTVHDIFTPKLSKATMYTDHASATQCMNDMRGYLGGFYGVALELCSMTDEELFQHRLAGT